MPQTTPRDSASGPLASSTSATPVSATKPPRRVVSAQPNSRLDPHGLSGTPTAQRVLNARRRRHLQTLWLSVLGSVAVVGAATFVGAQLLGISPTFANLPIKKIADLPFQAAGRAAVDGKGAMWVQASDAAVWKVQTNGSARKLYSATFPARSAPLLLQNHVVLGTQDGQIAVFDAQSGTKKWSRNLGAAVSTQPVLVRLPGNRAALVCGADNGQVTAFDFPGGAPLWSRRLNVPVGEGLKSAAGRVLVPTLGGQGGRGGLVALQAETGALAWRFPDQITTQGAGICAPFFDAQSNRVFWANDEGTIVAVSAQNGAKIWKSFAVPLEKSGAGKPQSVVLRGSPMLVGGALVVGGNDGVLRAFAAKTGDLLWATPLGAPIDQAVQSAGELSILARTGTGEAFVIGLASGEILRRARLGHSSVWQEKQGFDFSSNSELMRVSLENA